VSHEEVLSWMARLIRVATILADDTKEPASRVRAQEVLALANIIKRELEK
jgi:hypothetical protein